MVVSTIEPEQLVESLGKEKVILIPLSEYQALLDRLKELESSAAHKLAAKEPTLAPVSLKGVWGAVVVDEDDFAAASRSLFQDRQAKGENNA